MNILVFTFFSLRFEGNHVFHRKSDANFTIPKIRLLMTKIEIGQLLILDSETEGA